MQLRHRCHNYRRGTTTKTQVFASLQNSHRTSQLAVQKHSFFQNADSRLLMNTAIRSILTLFTSCKHRHQYYVPVKSKLKHPPSPGPAYPGHLMSFPAREGGNLMNLVFPRAGHLITTHRDGEFDRSLISCYELR